MHSDFCVEALKEALSRFGKPEIFNTDRGSQFTGADWIKTQTKAEMKVSMDGRGRYLDNIFLERLRRSLKQEVFYLTEIKDGFHAEQIIENWFSFFNTKRPHAALQNRTPDQPDGLLKLTN